MSLFIVTSIHYIIHVVPEFSRDTNVYLRQRAPWISRVRESFFLIYDIIDYNNTILHIFHRTSYEHTYRCGITKRSSIQPTVLRKSFAPTLVVQSERWGRKWRCHLIHECYAFSNPFWLNWVKILTDKINDEWIYVQVYSRVSANLKHSIV